MYRGGDERSQIWRWEFIFELLLLSFLVRLRDMDGVPEDMSSKTAPCIINDEIFFRPSMPVTLKEKKKSLADFLRHQKVEDDLQWPI